MTDLETTEPSSRLGAAFWVIWGVAMTVAIGAMLAIVAYTKTQMSGVASTVAGGATVLGFTVLLIGIAMAPHVVRARQGAVQPMRPAMRRYLMRFLPAMLGYVVLLLAAVSLWRAHEPAGLLAWAIALAPALPVLLAVRAIGLLIREETDEFQVARMSWAYHWATMATLSVCSVYGFLDMFGVVPDVELWVVFAIWSVALVPAQAIACRRMG